MTDKWDICYWGWTRKWYCGYKSTYSSGKYTFFTFGWFPLFLPSHNMAVKKEKESSRKSNLSHPRSLVKGQGFLYNHPTLYLHHIKHALDKVDRHSHLDLTTTHEAGGEVVKIVALLLYTTKAHKMQWLAQGLIQVSPHLTFSINSAT